MQVIDGLTKYNKVTGYLLSRYNKHILKEIITFVLVCIHLFITHLFMTQLYNAPGQYPYNFTDTNNYNMQFIYSALSLNELKVLYMFLPQAHMYIQTPQGSIQPRYMLQGAPDDLCTIAFCALPGSHLRLTSGWEFSALTTRQMDPSLKIHIHHIQPWIVQAQGITDYSDTMFCMCWSVTLPLLDLGVALQVMYL